MLLYRRARDSGALSQNAIHIAVQMENAARAFHFNEMFILRVSYEYFLLKILVIKDLSNYEFFRKNGGKYSQISLKLFILSKKIWHHLRALPCVLPKHGSKGNPLDTREENRLHRVTVRFEYYGVTFREKRILSHLFKNSAGRCSSLCPVICMQ